MAYSFEEWNECVTNSSYQRSTITQSRGCLRTVKLVMITMVRWGVMSFNYSVSRWPIWHSISPDCLDRKLVTSVLIVLTFWKQWEYLSLVSLAWNRRTAAADQYWSLQLATYEQSNHFIPLIYEDVRVMLKSLIPRFSSYSFLWLLVIGDTACESDMLLPSCLSSE